MPKCLKCNGSAFEVKNMRFEQEIKKQTVEVVVPTSVCVGCNAPQMDDEQKTTLRKAVADRYRESHGLLTSAEIVGLRDKLGMSQIAFARFLNVGEASIKRWETYYIQDVSQDDHIRIKCDPVYSESHFFYLQSRCGDVDVYSGMKSFSPHFVKQVSEFFEQANPECSQHLRKLHFYTDFLHFKRHSRSITGMRYTPLKSGPAPCNYSQLSQFLQRSQLPPAKSVEFDDQEKETLEEVRQLFLQDQGQMLSDFAVQEKGFLETCEEALISYEHAKDLLI